MSSGEIVNINQLFQFTCREHFDFIATSYIIKMKACSIFIKHKSVDQTTPISRQDTFQAG